MISMISDCPDSAVVWCWFEIVWQFDFILLVAVFGSYRRIHFGKKTHTSDIFAHMSPSNLIQPYTTPVPIHCFDNSPPHKKASQYFVTELLMKSSHFLMLGQPTEWLNKFFSILNNKSGLPFVSERPRHCSGDQHEGSQRHLKGFSDIDLPQHQQQYLELNDNKVNTAFSPMNIYHNNICPLYIWYYNWSRYIWPYDICEEFRYICLRKICPRHSPTDLCPRDILPRGIFIAIFAKKKIVLETIVLETFVLETFVLEAFVFETFVLKTFVLKAFVLNICPKGTCPGDICPKHLS